MLLFCCDFSVLKEVQKNSIYLKYKYLVTLYIIIGNIIGLRSHCQFLGLTTTFSLQVWVLKCPGHTETYSSVSNTVCMNVQRESSPYSLPVTIATGTKVKSKMATSIKLKVLSLSDTTVQSSCEFIRQIFVNRQQLFIFGWEQSMSRAQNTKLTGGAPVENWLDLKLSDDTRLISPSL